MRAALRRAFAWAESLVGTRRGVGLLALVALADYALVSLAMPLVEGRDLGTYLRYWSQLFDAEPALPMSMLFRTPVAPLVIGGSLDTVGPLGTQVVLGLLYAGTIVAWTAVGAAFGRRAAVFVAVAMLLFPGWAIFFHTIGSDPIFAAAFAGWAWLLTRAWTEPSSGRFALVGLGLAVLALVRPGNQALLVVVLVPLLLRAPWRDRVLRVAALVVPCVAVLGLWAVHNGVRYHDYTVARGGNAFFPFYRALTADRIIRPENGPASRELAALVERDLLTSEPYRSYRIDADTFFAQATPRVWEDAVTLVDRTQGWGDDYALLRRVGLEAVREHPGTYARGVVATVAHELRTVMTYQPAVASGLPPGPAGKGAPVEVDRPVELPVPSEGELIPSASQGFFTTTPDGSVREVWTSPTEHHVVSSDPGFAARLARMDHDDARLREGIPPYGAVEPLTRVLNLASRLYPRSAVWLLVGLVAVAVRRPRRSALALTLAGLCLWLATVNALGIYAILEFVLPTVPALVVLTAAGLVGVRRPAHG